MDQVLDQKLSEEVTYLPLDEVVKYQHNYVVVMETEPTPDVKPTIEQLTALHYVMKMKRAPYAEFAVFGPFGTRTLRRIKMSNVIMMPGGEFQTIEIHGPGDLACWMKSYDVLASSLIMLDAVRRPRLAKYRAKIEYLHEQFGPATWGVLYQADVRCRGELMDDLHHKHLHHHNNAVTAGNLSMYNTVMPWDAVWFEATNDTDWWKKEFEMPAMRITFSKTSPARELGDFTTGGPQPKKPRGGAGQPSKPPPTNPGPPQLCRDFNRGRCGPGCSRIHKCSTCGSEAHGAHACKPAGKPNKPNKPNNRKGKGKGNKK